MPGFLAKTGISPQSSLFENMNVHKRNKVNDSLEASDLYVERLTVNKFMGDKVFFSDNNFLVLVEGVILNSCSLMLKYSKTTFKDCIVEMYKTNGEAFFNEFRGNFCGILYDIKNRLTIVYTDHIGSKQIFYSKIAKEYVFSSDMLYIAEFFKHNNISRNLCINGAYYLLTLGSMLEDATLFDDVKRLLPGHYIKIQNDNFEIKRYYKLNFSYDCKLSEEDIINNLDILFTEAVKSAFEKDKEYGYKHIVNLSAGLDSRMTTFVAHKLGYAKGGGILNNTLSQTGYWDEVIPKQITADLMHQWSFKSLDNGIYLMDIEKAIKITCGMSSCTGCSHGTYYYDTFNLDDFGLVHSGQLGDAIVRSIISRNSKSAVNNYSLKPILNSKFIDLEKRIDYSYQLTYDNEEDLLFFTRSFLGNNQGLLAAQQYSETYSPFYDIDFMQFCFNIPLKYRMNHQLYYKWILLKHPKAANYMHDRIGVGVKINTKKITVLGHTVPITKLPHYTCKYIYSRLTGKRLDASKRNMNPFEYWYNTNDELRNIIDEYYQHNIGELSLFPELEEDCRNIFQNGSASEKLQVLTLAGMLKMYF